MLEFELSDDRPLLREGITCKLEAGTVTVDPEDIILDYCFCDKECDQDLLVFAGNDRRTNDYFVLYYKSKDETATVSFFIDDEEITDDSLGSFIPNGYRVDFSKVYAVKGGGRYELSIEVEEFGSTRNRKWGNFLVAPFDLKRADGTTRIRAFQNGNLENEFDFEDENVEFEVRIPAVFTKVARVIDSKYNPTNSRIQQLVHKRAYNEYELKFDSSKYQFMCLLFENMLQGSEVFIDDYNLRNGAKQINNLLVIEEDSDFDPLDDTITNAYVVKFSDGERKIVKHPFI